MESEVRLGWLKDDFVVDVFLAQRWVSEQIERVFPHTLPTDLFSFLQNWEANQAVLQEIFMYLSTKDVSKLQVEGEEIAVPVNQVILHAPLRNPRSIRDFYAFEQHVKTSFARIGRKIPDVWYQFPVFYYANPHTIYRTEEPVTRPKYTEQLDFELEVACIIGKRGKNILAKEAIEYIAGFCVMNDWSARDIQMLEMQVGLGPAKGKDFATSLGPYLVTLDELEDRRIGEHWDLEMMARVNGVLLSKGNMKDLYYSFAQMIERASMECELLPGDIIGSGTVGSGCLLELGTEVHRWLKPGDVVELEIERLGTLKNVVI